VVPNTEPCDQEKGVDVTVKNINTYAATAKARLLDRWLDKAVEASGSEFVYFTIIIALLTWAFLGIPFGRSNTWQVAISDAQAIVQYGLRRLPHVPATEFSRLPHERRRLSKIAHQQPHENA
jgi:hypothetical protein